MQQIISNTGVPAYAGVKVSSFETTSSDWTTNVITHWTLISSDVTAEGNKIYRFRNTADPQGIQRILTISVNPLKNVYNNRRFIGMLETEKLASTRGVNISISIEDLAATYDAGPEGTVAFANADTEYIIPIWSNFSFNYPVDCKLLTPQVLSSILDTHLGDIIANVQGIGTMKPKDSSSAQAIVGVNDSNNTMYYGVNQHTVCCQ